MTCVALGAISAYAAFMYRLRSAEPVLQVVDPSLLDFGQVNVQDQASRKIRLLNAGRHRLEIGDLKASCGCVQVTASTMILEPGASTEVALNFDFLSVANRNAIPAATEFAVNLYVVTKPPHREVFRWQLTGNVNSVFRRVPELVELRSQGVLAQPLNGTFDLEFHQPIDDLAVTVDDPGVQVRSTADVERRRFQIEVKAELKKYGSKELALQFIPMVNGAPQSPVVTHVLLEKLADVRAEPAFINLGLVDSTRQDRAAVQLVSASESVFRVVSTCIQSSASDATAESSLVVESVTEKPQFVISPLVSTAGTHNGVVVFAVEQHNERYDVSVPYSFHVLEPAR